jgi:L-alanine-DL-glutamate epimerase-like enolase superfamily enzyme
MGEKFSHFGVTWFEEPVSSDDIEGLTSLRNRLPHGMEIAAGEYGYETGLLPAPARSRGG